MYATWSRLYPGHSAELGLLLLAIGGGYRLAGLDQSSDPPRACPKKEHDSAQVAMVDRPWLMSNFQSAAIFVEAYTQHTP